ncbi:MAG: hypothetical protein CMP48_12490 [Rickettsiales bacterium]|nr:hypothetical protein [Rickettsiales bacterium]
MKEISEKLIQQEFGDAIIKLFQLNNQEIFCGLVQDKDSAQYAIVEQNSSDLIVAIEEQGKQKPYLIIENITEFQIIQFYKKLQSIIPIERLNQLDKE